jgi:hypothetical protein
VKRWRGEGLSLGFKDGDRKAEMEDRGRGVQRNARAGRGLWSRRGATTH